MATIVLILLWMSVIDDFGVIFSSSVLNAADIVITVLIWISTALTVISGIVYLKGYWNLIDSDK